MSDDPSAADSGPGEAGGAGSGDTPGADTGRTAPSYRSTRGSRHVDIPADGERAVLPDGGGVVARPRVTDGGDSVDWVDVPDEDEAVVERDVEAVFEAFEEDTVEDVIESDAGEAGRAPEEGVEEAVGDLLGDLSEVPGEDGDRAATDLRDRTGDDDDALFVEVGDGGHWRPVGDAAVDEVFEDFEEDTPEEVAAAADRPHDHPDPHPAAGPAAPDPSDDAGGPTDDGGLAAWSGSSPGDGGPTRTERVRSALSDVEVGNGGTGVAGDGGLVARTGEDVHRAAGESDVDSVFEGFEEETPEEVIDAAETADAPDRTAPETEDDVEGLVGDLSGVDLDPDPGVAPEAPPTAPEDPEAAVEDLFSDLPDVGERDPGETESEVESLLGDLSTVTVGGETDSTTAADLDAAHPDSPDTAADGEHPPAEATGSPAESAGSPVEADDAAVPDPDPAPAEPSVLDTGEAGGGFQWLGEDVHVLEGESDVEGVFEDFEEDTVEEIVASADEDGTDPTPELEAEPETVPEPEPDPAHGPDPVDPAAAARAVPGVSAAATFARVGGDLQGSPDVDLPRPRGWPPTVIGAGVRGTWLYDDIAPEDPILVWGPEMTDPGGDEGDEADGTAEADGEPVDAGAAADPDADADLGTGSDTPADDRQDAPSAGDPPASDRSGAGAAGDDWTGVHPDRSGTDPGEGSTSDPGRGSTGRSEDGPTGESGDGPGGDSGTGSGDGDRSILARASTLISSVARRLGF